MQLREKDILGCLPLLASVLGNTYGVHVRIGGSDACTDGNMIQLPSLPVDCGEELLLLVRGFIDHESAHIRYTDFKAFKEAALDAVTKNMFNAIEGWRVENRRAAVFPGCRHNFHELIRRFFVEDATKERAGERSLALSVLNYVLLTVRSWDVPEVSQPLGEETISLDTHFPGMRQSLDLILAQMPRYVQCHPLCPPVGTLPQVLEIPVTGGTTPGEWNPDGKHLRIGKRQRSKHTRGFNSWDIICGKLMLTGRGNRAGYSFRYPVNASRHGELAGEATGSTCSGRLWKKGRAGCGRLLCGASVTGSGQGKSCAHGNGSESQNAGYAPGTYSASCYFRQAG